MDIENIQNELSSLLSDLSKENFFYDFLKVFNFPNSTITKLRNANKSEITDLIELPKRIVYLHSKKEDIHISLENLKKDKKYSKNKPKFFIVTDFQTLLANNTKTNENLDIDFKELSKKADFFLPLVGKEKITNINENEADIKAAYKMISIYDEILNLNPSHKKDDLNILFARLLFCLFAEDSGIFPDNIFTNSLNLYTDKSGSDLDDYLNKLFTYLKTEDSKETLFQDYPYTNGLLFENEIKLPKFNQKIRSMLIESSKLDWSNINPDIFGSMIQVVANNEDRSNLGMHYTSVPNILKVINPLFLDDINSKIDLANSEKELKLLLNRLYKIKIFDPACGSGNFLIISYKFLSECEIKIFEKLISISPENWNLLSSGISINQFYGIEIEEFSSVIAKVSLIIAKQQVLNKYKQIFGNSSSILPLKDTGNIVNANSSRIDWINVCKNDGDNEIYLIGNPPYKGARYQKQFHKDDLSYVFKGSLNEKKLDYISIWFYLASIYSNITKAKFCFVTTNSLNQGEQVILFWPKIISLGMQIIFAHKSIKWSNNASYSAGVMVSIIALASDKINFKEKYLFHNDIKQSVKNINSYLYPGSNIFVSPKNKPISNIQNITTGNRSLCNGNMFFNENEYQNLIKENELSKKFLKKALGAYEFLNGINKYCLWIEDKDLQQAKSIKTINHRLNKIQKFREDKSTNTPSHKFLNAKLCKEYGFIIPQTSSELREYLPIGIFNHDAVVIDPNFGLYDPEMYLFGILSSKMHISWLQIVGGRLENRYRYSSKLVFNTFPISNLTDDQKKSLESISDEIILSREKFPEISLANLYHPNKMPKTIVNLHKELDNIVDGIFSNKMFFDNNERVNVLFQHYEKMTNQGELF